MRTTALPRECCCPACGTRLEEATSTPDSDVEVPEPGALSVCVYCGAVLWFTADLTLMAITPDDWAAMDAETRALVERTRADVARAHADAIIDRVASLRANAHTRPFKLN
jgi:hypothetical protein